MSNTIEEQLEIIINTSMKGVVIVNENGLTVSSNQKIEKICKKSVDELKGVCISSFFDASDSQGNPYSLSDLINQQIINIQNSTLICKKTMESFKADITSYNLGTDHFYMLAISPLNTKSDIFIGQHDSLNHNALVKEELVLGLELATKAGNISMWYWNMETNIIEWDEGMHELYGIEQGSELSYEDWVNALQKDERARIEEKLTESIKNNTTWEEIFKITRSSDKEDRWIKAAAYIITKNNNDRVMFGINQDITKEKSDQLILEEEIRNAKDANEAKSRFLAMMSHEIRTPMNGIIGMLDLVNGTDLTTEQSEMITTIEHSAESLLAVINDVLDFSKIEAGQMTIEHISTSIIDVIEKSINTLWINIRNEKKNIYSNIDLKIPKRVIIDPIKLRQIILNLIGNSIKFTKKKSGKIFLDAKFVPASDKNPINFISISVRDNGIGMNEEQISKLFTPFSQADESTTRRFGGTGLGLSITKSFVEIMGGNVSVESTINEGSTFTINLPAHDLPDEKLSYQDIALNESNVVIITNDQYDSIVLSNLYLQLDGCVYATQDINDIIEITSHEDMSLIIISDELFSTGQFDKIIKQKNTSTIVMEKGLIHNDIENYSHTVLLNSYPIVSSKFITKTVELMNLDVLFDSEIYKDIEKSFNQDKDLDANIKSNIKILIAEDQETNRKVLTLQMNKIEIEFDIVNDGYEALEAWRNSDYSMILTDINMPNMDGFDLARSIRKEESEKSMKDSIPIIAITANALTGDKDLCLEAGMNDYLSKPLSITGLKEKILHWSAHSKPLKSVAKLEANTRSNTEDIKVRSNIPSPIDFEAIYEIIGTDDIDVIHPLLDSYIDTLNNSLKTIISDYKSKKIDNIRSVSHSAKGAADSVGAKLIAKICNEIQLETQNPKNTDLVKLLNLIKSLVKNTKELNTYLVNSGITKQ